MKNDRNASVPVLSGRGETEFLVTDTLGAVATPRYSKRSSGRFKFSLPLLISVNFVSILPDLC